LNTPNAFETLTKIKPQKYISLFYKQTADQQVQISYISFNLQPLLIFARPSLYILYHLLGYT